MQMEILKGAQWSRWLAVAAQLDDVLIEQIAIN